MSSEKKPSDDAKAKFLEALEKKKTRIVRYLVVGHHLDQRLVGVKHQAHQHRVFSVSQVPQVLQVKWILNFS